MCFNIDRWGSGAEACRRRPTLKVLFTTAYARNAIVHHGIARQKQGERRPRDVEVEALGETSSPRRSRCVAAC
jgi:hypothetical protein